MGLQGSSRGLQGTSRGLQGHCIILWVMWWVWSGRRPVCDLESLIRRWRFGTDGVSGGVGGGVVFLCRLGSGVNVWSCSRVSPSVFFSHQQSEQCVIVNMVKSDL